MPSVMWLRRDLRLGDNPALLDACAADDVLPLFVIDPALWGPSGPVRRSYLGASLRGWRSFVEDRVDDYAEARDKPGVNGTSHLSAHLKYGEIHPRTILADLSRHDSTGAATYRTEIAWRDFYPTSQGRKFDPKADYVRRWLPELSLARDPHDPDSEDRAAAGYPEPIVDHKAERREALNRWEKIRQ